ncbi:hypothetical protein [Zoogloea sp.]|uniref:hypothetical protein n=1 Tax=Zoogloea sp. TaxID=49181 RepID=UPI001D3052DE|nr:hypothetical protein [Zoogloea sp.]MBK6653465.1 hypothetical protein [Zoogloea sp.]HQX05314.1 hypothetical protein [Zoogloea sp.]
MRTPVLLLSMAACIALLSSGGASALPPSQSGGGLGAVPGSASPFGGARAPGQVGVRPESLRRPSSTLCGPGNRPGNSMATTRRDPSGRIHISGDSASPSNRNGNVYNCAGKGGSGKIRANAGAGKAKSAYNARTNTLNAATDGYVNRSATSSMMPRKTPSMYDPATGVLRPSRKLNAYEIYQR